MPFGSLWLPGVVSAVAVFFLSFLLHMILRYHKADFKPLPDEEAIAGPIRKAGLSPGVYFIPYCSEPSQMKDPAMVKKFTEGPVVGLTVRPNGPPALGPGLAQWFLLCLFVSFVAAYVARHTLSPGSPGLEVMRITGTLAFAAYGFGYFQDSIWKGIPWPSSLRGLIDAALYALATGLVFRWLWPGV
ncbi:MAG TPA: hypothetical protein VLR69_19620 [Thermoanaerobaculia bacterium]|nr:hypothetical protein [Thermoanaerobaculia bacterium]